MCEFKAGCPYHRTTEEAWRISGEDDDDRRSPRMAPS